MATVINNSNIKNFVDLYVAGKKEQLPEDLQNKLIGEWDVSRVTNMSRLFMNATNFNEPLNSWDVSQTTDMSHMFHNAKSFNQLLNDWDVSRVTNMSYMFYNAISLNQPFDKWLSSKVRRSMAFIFHIDE